MSDLFQSAGLDGDAPRPLADRLRPQRLADVVGQDHIIGPDAPLGRMLNSNRMASIILWGPPGVGKTTVARLLADESELHFVQISAIFTGVPDLKKVFETARLRRQNGQGTLLFVDEIHRFNKAQQDGFLPHMEDGTILLVGATTENPSFELNAAVLSRSQVLVLDRLSGLLLLFIYACGLALFLKNNLLEDFKILIGIMIPLSVVAFYFLNKKFFGNVLPVFWQSVGYSALVQLSQLICAYFILKSLGIEMNVIAYLLIFLISSIVSVIPLTIGGIGSRELTFFSGAAWLGLNESTSVGISMLFFLITAVVSLIGIIYHFKRPKLEVN